MEIHARYWGSYGYDKQKHKGKGKAATMKKKGRPPRITNGALLEGDIIGRNEMNLKTLETVIELGLVGRNTEAEKRAKKYDWKTFMKNAVNET